MPEDKVYTRQELEHHCINFLKWCKSIPREKAKHFFDMYAHYEMGEALEGTLLKVTNEKLKSNS